MNYLNKFKIILYLLLFLPFCTQAAWEAPAGNPLSNNDTYSFIYNDLGGSNDIYIFDTPFGIGDDFEVDSSLFVVDTSNNRVGVNTNTPVSTLDVNGLLRIAPLPYSSFPTCTDELEGSLLFNTDQDLLNICVNNGWRQIGYDGDLDRWLEPEDCDDTDPNRNPESEVCGDDVSNDCDTLINEGCVCTPIDWYDPVCPDMSSCTVPINVDGEKKTDCEGEDNRPSTECECVCREGFWTTPTCPGCDHPSHRVYGELQDGYDCVDDNDLQPYIDCPFESCSCLEEDWDDPVCPDMSNCTEPVTVYGTKNRDCEGNDYQPSKTCDCVCRSDSWETPTCPGCGPNQTIYGDLKTDYSCDDDNNTQPSIYCSASGCPGSSSFLSCGSSYGVSDEYLKVYENTTSYSCENGSCVVSTNKTYVKTCPSLGGTGGCSGGVCTDCYDYCGPCGYCSSSCTQSNRVCTWSGSGVSCTGCNCVCTGGGSSSGYCSYCMGKDLAGCLYCDNCSWSPQGGLPGMPGDPTIGQCW